MKRYITLLLIVLLLIGIAVNAYAQYRRRWIPRLGELLAVRDAAVALLEREKYTIETEILYQQTDDDPTVPVIQRSEDGLSAEHKYISESEWIPEAQGDAANIQNLIDSLQAIGR